MKRNIICLATLIAVCIATTVFAKRVAPKAVSSVTKDGIEYSVPHDRMGFVVAKWIKRNPEVEIWSRQIYTVKFEYTHGLSRCVQACFITSLKLDGEKLKVINERGSEFELHLNTLEVKTIKGTNVIDYTKHTPPNKKK